MGNNSNKNEGENRIEHQKFGLVKLEILPTSGLKTDPTDEEEEQEEDHYFMHISRTIQSETIYKDWVKAMKQIKDSQIKQILLLPQKYHFQSIGLCGSRGIALTYTYYQFVLTTEIRSRNMLKKDFTETEIWYLLYNILRLSNKFEQMKRKIGNVHPGNVLINQSGQINIISTCSLPGELMEQQNQKKIIVYLAPEEINNNLILKGTYPSNIDPCLAEVFSIGLTILSSGTLQDCDSVYRRNPYEIRRDRLSTILKIFQQKYSDFLFQTVASMLTINPHDRRKSSELYQMLSQYKQQIMDLQPFQVQKYRAPSMVNSPNATYQQTQINYGWPIFQGQPQFHNTQQPQRYYHLPSSGERGQPYNQGTIPAFNRPFL